MCGIAGVLRRRAEGIESAITRIMRRLGHRGPDDQGAEVRACGPRTLALGHRRLSILDCSRLGHQPMIHPPTGAMIVFNGEIYNFKALRDALQQQGESFRSGSDTEVLLCGLTRHGRSFLRRLQGMYALAYYDPREQSLLLARDPLGIKPLYYYQAGDTLIFASELHAMLGPDLVPGEVDPEAVAGMLATGAVPEPLTICRGVRMFPAGAAGVTHLSQPDVPLRIEPFWSTPAAPTEPNGDVVAKVRRAIDDAVRDHLVSDVPVGVFLSSGIDSTIVAALAGKHSPHIKAFTIGFAEHADMSEMPMAKRTADLFNLDHTGIDITDETAVSWWHEWLASMDQPTIDGLNTYIISKAVRQRGIVVALSGQGGDELFGGYPSFVDVPKLQRMLTRLAPLPAPMRRVLFRVMSAGKPSSYRQKLLDIADTKPGLLPLYLHRRRLMSDPQLRDMGLQSSSELFLPMETVAGLPVDATDARFAISIFESRLYQQNVLLRDSDVFGMASSLEIRVPLLDQRVADLAFSLPGAFRTPPKTLLRRAFPDLLRTEVLEQSKRGFTLPVRRWMRGQLRDFCVAAIDRVKASGLLSPTGVQQVWDQFEREPESPAWTRALALVVLGSQLHKLQTMSTEPTIAEAVA